MTREWMVGGERGRKVRIGAWREGWREFGVRGFWRRAGSALDVYREVYFYVLDMTTEPETPTARIALEMGRLGEADLAEYTAMRPGWAGDSAEARWRDGGVCFVARHEGRIAGFGWAMEQGDEVDFVPRRVGADPAEIYIADTYTDPRYRGLGVNPAVLRWLCRHYYRLGRRRAVAATLPYNLASRRAFEKAGFQLARRSGYWGRGGWRRQFDRETGG